MKKYIISIGIIVIILFALFGSYYIYSTNNSENNIDILKEKADKEIDYIDNTIISMLNKLNNITYANYEIVEEEVSVEQSNNEQSSSGGEQSQGQSSGGGGQQSNTITNININESSILVNPNKKIDWNNIKMETEKMYSTWTTVMIDLNALNVNKDNLRKYSTVLDNVTKAVQDENKAVTATELTNLYGLLVSYVRDYSEDTKKINIFDTKSNILYAYANIEEDKWDDMKNNIQKAQNVYNSIMNSALEGNINVASINKVYVLLNEIQKTTDNKDKNIFYINYKNLIQELEILED